MKRQSFLINYFSCLFSLVLFVSLVHADNSIVVLDKGGPHSLYTSLALDSQDNPIISYYDSIEAKLKIVRCIEKNCALLNIFLTPDAAKKAGQYASLTLDHQGNPVIAYYDEVHAALKVLHCGNASCSADNTITTPDSFGTVGQYASLTVDKEDRPVISYYDAGKELLRIIHCGNQACSRGNIIVTPDRANRNGAQSAIKLNAAGNPVVAYFDFTQSALKILTCGNAECTENNHIVVADSTHGVGQYPSLVLDKNDKPVVSYLDFAQGKLNILHCGNATCGLDNSIISVGQSTAGHFSSLVLDAKGCPIVSYYDSAQGRLNVLHCGDAACKSGNTLAAVDTVRQIGQYTSLKLDTEGNPVVSYYDAAEGKLKLLHCANAGCHPSETVQSQVE